MLSGPMNALWLLIGLVAGAGAVLLAVRPRLRSLSVEAARAGELERELVRARSALEHERALGQERLATLTDAQERLSASFKALSADALKSSIDQLTELNRAQLNAARAEARGDLDTRRQAVEQLVAPLKEQLGRVDAQLLQLDQERRESRGRLEAQLKTLAETGERLRTETGALVTALRKPNARGQWGQMQLRNVVELAGMVRYCDFAEQSPVAGDETTLRPDLIVNLPGRQARRRRRQGAAAGRARRLPGPRRGGAPAAPARSRAAAAPAREGARRQGVLGGARLRAGPRRDVPARRASVRRRARGRSRR